MRGAVRARSLLTVVIIPAIMPAACADSDDAAPKAVSIPFEVCGQDENWVRPTREEQLERLVLDRRFEPEIDETMFGAHFFRMIGTPSQEYKFETLAGLWSASDGRGFGALLGDCADDPSVATGGTVELWILLHEVKSVSFDNRTVTIRVEPRDRRAAAVQFESPDPERTFDLFYRFIGPDDEVLGEIGPAASPGGPLPLVAEPVE